MKLCDFIKEYRKNNNYSLRDFSRISSISASELCNIENSNTISKKTLEKLSKYFEQDLTDFSLIYNFTYKESSLNEHLESKHNIKRSEILSTIDELKIFINKTLTFKSPDSSILNDFISLNDFIYISEIKNKIFYYLIVDSENINILQIKSNFCDFYLQFTNSLSVNYSDSHIKFNIILFGNSLQNLIVKKNFLLKTLYLYTPYFKIYLYNSNIPYNKNNPFEEI